MNLTHDQGQEIVVDFLLQNWRGGKNLNNYISSEIERIREPADWPSPDAFFQVPDKESTIAIEYKPSRETKRGMLTGLGQAISYLQRANASYLVSPKIVDGVDMEDFFINLFEKHITDKLPVGLVITEGEDLDKIRVVVDIKEGVKNNVKYKESSGSYWAKFRDIKVSEVVFLLKCIKETKSKSTAWDMFFDNYYCPQKCRTFNVVENDMLDANMSRGKPGEQIKTKINEIRKIDNQAYDVLIEHLNKEFNQSKSEEDFKGKFIDGMKPSLSVDENMMIFLENKLWYKKNHHSHRGLENIRMNYQKNYKNFIFHIGLVDSLMQITEVGERFLERCLERKENYSDEHFISFTLSEIGALTLTIGKHRKIINDIMNFQEDKNFSNRQDLKKYIFDQQLKKGHIAQNVNRSTSKVREHLNAETQLWHHFSILTKDKNIKYNFDFNKIEKLEEIYLFNYYDLHHSSERLSA